MIGTAKDGVRDQHNYEKDGDDDANYSCTGDNRTLVLQYGSVAHVTYRYKFHH